MRFEMEIQNRICLQFKALGSVGAEPLISNIVLCLTDTNAQKPIGFLARFAFRALEEFLVPGRDLNPHSYSRETDFKS